MAILDECWMDHSPLDEEDGRVKKTSMTPCGPVSLGKTSAKRVPTSLLDNDVFLNTTGEPLFDPQSIRHPRSSEWSLPDHLAQIVHYWASGLGSALEIKKNIQNIARTKLENADFLTMSF
ncbi:Hypothetical predicted protein [Pelobates cultripes]|uniref:Uncharacterized protein n=1 Tax=Pelobates cultripes TaxID=61616 RepID=A0AAD1RRU8_PELCU|nr:Hypothetical predicted protein [Pelobates cultripes]